MSHDERTRAFHDLHQQGSFVLPNAWDAASAAVMVDAGARALGTTSSGMSWSLGHCDGENLTLDENLAAVARMIRTVDVPISADLEAGYGEKPADVGSSVEAAIEVGASGANLEDNPRLGEGIIMDADEMAERLAAAREAAGTTQFVINARTDVYLNSVGDPAEREEMVIERAKVYAEAGATCLFVPGVGDLDEVARIVAGSPLPINSLFMPGYGPSLDQLKAAGVRRISLGGSVASAAYATARLAVQQAVAGSDTALLNAIPHGEMQALMGGS
jgi:2-methylisocitrate lyase-like PEP mutase family enzyme